MRDITMAIFRSADGREIDEKDIIKAVKYYEYLYNAKHTEVNRSDRSNRGGSKPKPAAKVRKALATRVGHTSFVGSDGSKLVLHKN